MNEDEMENSGPHAGEELERTLARYARVRLEPSPAQVRRARAAVLEEASRRLAADGASARRRPFVRMGTRRLTASLAAAVLVGLVLGTSVFAASRAGGTLYEARLALESLGMPVDPEARVAAEVAYAQSRLAEAMEASAHRDRSALEAALVAYEASIERMKAATGESAGRALEAIRFHRAILLDVLASAPSEAVSGLSRAIAQSELLIERFEAAGAGRPGDPSPGGTVSGSGPDRTAGPEKPAVPDKTPRPDKTPGADKPAGPDKPTGPDATKRPDRSPRPGGPRATDDQGQRSQPTARP